MATSDSDCDGAFISAPEGTIHGRDAIDGLVRAYYLCLNERRLTDAAALFTEDAAIEHVPTGQAHRGGAAYLEFASAWLAAFPDLTVAIEGVVSRQQGRAREVALLATGTHRGPFDIAGRVFKPTGTRASLHVRELLGFENGKLAFSNLSFDVHELIAQLVSVDAAKLLTHLERLRHLEERLRTAGRDAVRREVIDQIGLELDAARQEARPYFKR